SGAPSSGGAARRAGTNDCATSSSSCSRSSAPPPTRTGSSGTGSTITKYFTELGYTRLYECANVAEAEQGFRRRVELRKTRDLTKNELVLAKYVLEDPERFKKGFVRPFTPERWAAFKKD